jgi:hypothetical protein
MSENGPEMRVLGQLVPRPSSISSFSVDIPKSLYLTFFFILLVQTIIFALTFLNVDPSLLIIMTRASDSPDFS